MCELCRDIKLKKKFYSSQDYLDTIKYIEKLLEIDNFILVEKSCELSEIKDNHWISDSIFHKIGCKNCGQIFTCFCDTYHGSGSFIKSNDDMEI